MEKSKEFLGAEPIADVIAVTFTAILFAAQFKKAIKNLQHDG